MRHLWIMVVLGSLLWPFNAWAEPVMTVIEMRHALPEQVLPLLNPLLKPEETATTFRGQLILYASPDTLARTRQLLDEVDRAPRNLWVQVTDRLTEVEATTAVEANAHIGHARADLSVGDRPRAADGLSVRVQDGQTRRDERLGQQIRAVEGYPAFIARRQTVPVASVPGRGGHQVVTQTAEQGFFVTARLQGSRVFLELSSSHDRLDAARLDSRRTVTTVSGRLEEWIAVAGLDEQQTETRRDLGSAGHYRSQGSGTLWLRVRIAD